VIQAAFGAEFRRGGYFPASVEILLKFICVNQLAVKKKILLLQIENSDISI
jgi:hypothetical protein